MTLTKHLLLAGIAIGLPTPAVHAADYYVSPAQPGAVAGAPLAAISLQATVNIKRFVSQTVGGKTVGKWIIVGQTTVNNSATTPTAPTAPSKTSETAPSTGSTGTSTTGTSTTGTSTTGTSTTGTSGSTAPAPQTGSTYPSLGALLQSGRVTGGDRIFLLAGSHGPLNIKDVNFTAPVTIAEMPGQTAQVDAIQIVNSSNLVFQNLSVWATSPNAGNSPVIRSYGGAHDLTFTNLDVRSAADAGTYVGWNLATWNAHKRGGFLVDGNNIKVIGNRVTGTYFALFALGNNALVQNNIIDGWAGDAMRVTGNGSTVRGNKAQNCFHIDANHDDGLQAASAAPGGWGSGTLDSVTIENNKIYEWNATQTNALRCKLQGIGMFDGQYSNIVIRNNVIAVSNWHGIAVAGGHHVTISENTVVNPRGIVGDAPWIKIAASKTGVAPTDVMVANNTTNAVKVVANTTNRVATANNIVVKNFLTEFTAPAQQNYTLLPTAQSANAAAIAYATKTDILGVPRPKGKGPDAGAYESQ